MTDEPSYFASTNHIQGISLYLKLTPRKPNNIQSFTVAPGLQFIFKALGFQIDSALTNRVVLDLKPAQRRPYPAAGCPRMVQETLVSRVRVGSGEPDASFPICFRRFAAAGTHASPHFNACL